jgi:hypothetical protein
MEIMLTAKRFPIQLTVHQQALNFVYEYFPSQKHNRKVRMLSKV